MLILHEVTAVEFEPAKVQGGVDIAIEGSAIVAVGTGLTARYPEAEVRPLQGRLAMPGIVCAHNHFYSGLARGILATIAPCPDFVSTLKNLWWRLDRALDQESLYLSGLVSALEAIRSGCTAVIDHHASPGCIGGSLDLLRQGFLQAGLRGILCYETTHRNGGEAELEAGVGENVAFARRIDAIKASGDQPHLVEAMIGAHAPFTIPRRGMELLRDAVQATGRGLHIHAAEDRYDVSHGHDVHGQDLIERLASHQLIDDRTIVAHGLYLSDADIGILNALDAFLAHNPRSNMNNRVGYNDRLGAFRNVVLGTDGIGADMFEELKFAFFKHRDASGPLWPDSFLRFLWNGNRILERSFGADFGRLAAGCVADLTICDYDSPTPLVAQNLGGHLAFGLGSRAVHSVLVDGRFVYEDRRFPFDVAPIYANARRAAAALWQRMDALDRTGAPA